MPDAGLDFVESGDGDSIGEDSGLGDAAHIFGHSPAGTAGLGVWITREEDCGEYGKDCAADSEDDEEPLPSRDFMLAF